MTKQTQAAETRSDQKNHSKSETAVAELASDQAGIWLLVDGQMSAAADNRTSNPRFASQTAWLSDRQVQVAQRRALAEEIGHLQGNGHLKQVVASLPRDRITRSNQQDPGNDLAHSLQRQESVSEPKPTEAEKAAALAAAKAAEAKAAQSANQGKAGASKSRAEKSAEKQSGEAAKQKSAQAKGEAKAAAKSKIVAKPASKKVKPKPPNGGVAPEISGAGIAPKKATVTGQKAPASSQEDPGFQEVAAKVRGTATRQKSHAPAGAKAAEAQAAAEPPTSEVESKAQANQVGEMESAETPGFDGAAFKAQLMQRIQELAPRTVQEADNFKGSNKLGSVKDEMKAKAAQEQAASKEPLKEATSKAPDSGGIEPKPVEPLPSAQPGPAPELVGAEAAAPKQKGISEVEAPIKENSKSIDQQMAEADVTDEQLAKSNEPEFLNALDAKKEAQTHAVQAPQDYRQFEQDNLRQAEEEAAAVAQENIVIVHPGRTSVLSQVEEGQSTAKSRDEQARASVAAEIQVIYTRTKTKVESILAELDSKVETTFDAGAQAARQTFEGYVDAKMEAYKESRYGGWLGWARWAKDKLMGMPPEVNTFYQQGRNLFLSEMDAVIDNVVAIIGAGLAEAKAEIANGRKEIQDYVNRLPQDLKEVGQETAAGIQDKFDQLETSVDEKQNELIDTLANKYQESLQAVDARIEEMKAANQGLVDKAINAVAGVIKTILKLKEMLTTVLAKVADVVGKIIKDPIGFLGNLISGLKQGFQSFVGNILTHLQTGLIGWLTGTLGPMGITLPDDLFSLEGIFSLVTQILGITWDYIRAKAVKLLGEPVVKALETGFEVFQILINEGPAGLWQWVKDEFTDLKEMVVDQIKDMMITEVIKAGVKWILGLLNPAGALVKAAMAIYDIVMFFIDRGSQILELVNAVVDGVAAVARGSVGAMAQKIENALAKALPVVIGFLANLLGLGGLAKKVQKIIQSVRRRIDRAIDKLIMKAKKAGKKLLGKIGGGKEKKVTAEEAEKVERGEFTEEDRKAGLAAFEKEERSHVEAGTISEEDANKVAGIVKEKHPVFQSISVVDGKDSWNYQYVFRADEVDTSSKKRENGTANVESLRSYRPSWRKSIKEELAAIDPELHEEETTKILSGFERRHITSFDQIRTDILNQVDGKTFEEAAAILGNKGFPPAKLDNEGIVEAIKEYLREKFNDVVNVWVGEAEENQERGRKMAAAKREMEQALAQGETDRFREAYESYREQAFDPEPIEYFYDKYRHVRERV